MVEIESAFSIIKGLGEEIIGEEELIKKIRTKTDQLMISEWIVFYDGFEPSGRLHIAQGLLRVHTINKIIETGIPVVFKIYIADEFAFLNGKMGGDMKKIQEAGRLMIETWKACGLNMYRTEFIWASEEMKSRRDDYWKMLMDISTKFNVERIKKCMTALGKEEDDNVKLSSLMYAAMQTVDIPFLKVDVASMGMDQRKIIALNREYSHLIKKDPPVGILHHILSGLNGKKMSKSDPDNAIFMDDTEQEINRKIRKAYCVEGEIEGNPIVEYVKYIIFVISEEFTVFRKEKYGGDLFYKCYTDFENDFVSKVVHPEDVKNSVAKYLNGYLSPVREKMNKNKEVVELSKRVKRYRK